MNSSPRVSPPARRSWTAACLLVIVFNPHVALAAPNPRPTRLQPKSQEASEAASKGDAQLGALALAARPVEGVRFVDAQRDVQGIRVAGLESRPDPVAPAELAGEEFEAWKTRASEAEPELKTFFPTSYAEPFVVEGDGVRVVIRALGGSASGARVEDGRLVYRGAYPQTDSIHRVQSGRSEEILLLHDESAPTQFDYEIVSVEGATQVFPHNGGIRFVDAKGRGLEIEPPWMVDANGVERRDGVKWELDARREGAGRRLKLTFDAAGLVFPLAIDPSWTTALSLRVNRALHTATLLQNGRLLVAGGFNNSILASAELFDPATGSWTQTANLNVRRVSHSATVLRNGKVLVAGGANGNAISSVELYDPSTGTWSVTGSLVTARSGHTATLLPNGKVLVVGGTGVGGGLVASAEVFDPASGMWAPTGSMVIVRTSCTTTLLPNGKVLVAGGSSTSSATLNSAELYDASTGTWTLTGNMGVSRALHIASLLPSGKVLIAAGASQVGTNLSSSEIYDPALGTWTASGNLNEPRVYNSATLLPNGRVLVTGGTRSDTLASSEIFDPSTGSWSLTPTGLSTPRAYHSATLLANGRVIVAGGTNNVSGFISSVEMFDYAVGTWTVSGNLSTPRTSMTALLLPNGLVLTAGGTSSLGSANAISELFNPASGTWTTTGSLAAARRSHTATLLNDGRVLVTGGFATEALSSCEIYNPMTGAWTPTGPMLVPRQDHTATLLADGSVLVAGGRNSLGTTESSEVFNPVVGAWSSVGAMTTRRHYHSATRLPNGAVLVAGGNAPGAAQAELVSSELFNPDTGLWTASGELTRSSTRHRATLLPSGKVLICGGLNGNSTSAFAQVFDPSTLSWSSVGTMTTPRLIHTATLLASGRVLVTGGEGDSVVALDSAEVFDPSTSTWQATPVMTSQRQNHAAVLLPSNKVLVVAGFDDIARISSTELFDEGFGSLSGWMPSLDLVTSPITLGDDSLVANGSRFQGISEASSGTASQSTTNFPLLFVQSIESDQVAVLDVNGQVGWSDTNFVSTPISGLLPGYALARLVANGISSASKVIKIEAIEAPTDLVATGISPSRIDLQWVDQSTSETGFIIERRIGAGVWSQHASVAANVTSFVDVGLDDGTLYSYRVRSLNLASTSSASEIASAMTTGCASATIVQQPQSQTVQSGQPATLFVVAQGAEPLSFQWFQQTSPGNFTPIGGATGSIYTTPALSSTSSFRVRVTDQCGFVDSQVAIVTVRLSVSSTADSGPGTLRQAISQANTIDGAKTIFFDIPGSGPHTIELTSALPAITKPVTIDGYSQAGSTPGAPVVVLSGPGASPVGCANDAGATVDGLHFMPTASGSIVRGLVINEMPGDGIEVEGGAVGPQPHVQIYGCFIGTNQAGTAAAANGRHGVFLNDSPNNRIGGETLELGCLISGNPCSGIEIRGQGAAGNIIRGCFIGTNAAGTAAIGNGTGINVDGAPNTVIASNDDAPRRNVVRNNSGSGVSNTGTVTRPFGTSSPNTIISGTVISGNGDAAIMTDAENAATVNEAVLTGNSLFIGGSAMVTEGNEAYTVEYFTNSTCQPTGGEGESFVARIVKQSSPGGVLSLGDTLVSTQVRPGELIAVTVTGPNGTSAFSLCRIVTGRLGVVAVKAAVVNFGGVTARGAESPLAPSPGLDRQFPGPNDDPAAVFVTADAQAAVGPNHLLAATNIEFVVQDKISGTVLDRAPVEAFFAAIRLGPTEVLDAFNPRAVYDTIDGRYTIAMTARDRKASSAVLVAVSQTSNPLGNWNVYRYSADDGDTQWADYPTLGFTKDWITVAVNMLSVGTDGLTRREIYALNKSALYSGAPGPGPGSVLGATGVVGTLVAAATYDPIESTQYLVANGNGNDAGVGRAHLYTVSGPVGAEVFAIGPDYPVSEPWQSQEPNRLDFAPQMSSATKVQVNDARMHSAVVRNGSVWCAQTVLLPETGTPTECTVQWWQLDPDGTLLQRGRVPTSGGTVFNAFPSIAVAESGNMMLGYARFSASTTPSAAYRYRIGDDAANTLRDEVLLQAGVAPYVNAVGQPPRNQWGNYSGAAVDPDGERLWVLGEYADVPDGTVGQWATWWGSIAPVDICTVGCPANVTVQTGPGASSCLVSVSYSPPTVGGACGTVTCSPASGAMFPVGATTVTCSDGGSHGCTFTVTVVDNTVPSFTTCPGPITVPAGASCQGTVPNLVSSAAATDNCAGVTITQSPAAGTALSLGVQPVILTATDAAGNTATCQVNVTVADQTAPSISCPSSITMPAAASACSRVVNFPLTVSDNCAGSITVTTSQSSGTEFVVGTTMVTVTATDAAGNSANCQFAVTIQDVTAPTMSCPANIETVALTGTSRIVNFAPPTPADACAGANVVCLPAPGSTFDVGTTMVTCTATDASNNQSQCSFTVAVAPLGSDTAGIYVPATGSWFLRNANSPGGADLVFGYGPGNLGWIALRGDWDGNGSDTVGLYDPANGFFFLKNTNAAGGADLVYGFGPPGLGWKPLVGDWNGDGVDTVGLYDPASGFFFLRNAHAAGAADLVYGFGPAAAGWMPLVGDWDGNASDTVGLYDPTLGNFFLRNSHAAGGADLVYGFGPAGLGWKPLAGDWNADGADTVGLYDGSIGFFFLRNVHAPGAADSVFGYGPANTTPILGDWNGQ